MPSDSSATSRVVVVYLLLLVVAAGVSLPGLFSRSISYDEAITLLDVAGNAAPGYQSSAQPPIAGSAAPGWPTSPQPVGDLKPRLWGSVSLSEIAAELRDTDMHPPLYYWALSFWRRAFGSSLEAARALSLFCSVLTVGLLYSFCTVGGVRHPILPSVTFALTYSCMDHAQQARALSLALLLVMGAALVALLLWKHEPKSPTPRFLGFAAIALLSSAAFLTNYLTVFPTGVIILWLAVVIQRGRAGLLMIVAFVSAATILPWTPALADQMRARPGHFSGFQGFAVELVFQLHAYADNLLRPTRFEDAGGPAFVVGIIAAACLCAVALLRTKSPERPQFLALVWGLALVPLVGVMTLDVLFDKHLVEERYFVYAVPAVAVLITYRLGSFRQPLQSLAYSALVVLWSSQLLSANWGYEITDGRRTFLYRSLGKSVDAVESDSKVLFSGIEWGDGVPGSLVYELPESLHVLFLRPDTDPVEAAAVLDRYEYVWQVTAGGPTSPVEHAVAERLSELGRTSQPAPSAKLFLGPSEQR